MCASTSSSAEGIRSGRPPPASAPRRSRRRRRRRRAGACAGSAGTRRARRRPAPNASTRPATGAAGRPRDPVAGERVAGRRHQARLDPVGRSGEGDLAPLAVELGGHRQSRHDVSGGSAGGDQHPRRSRLGSGGGSGLASAGHDLSRNPGGCPPRRTRRSFSSIPTSVRNTTRLDPPELISGSGTPGQRQESQHRAQVDDGLAGHQSGDARRPGTGRTGRGQRRAMRNPSTAKAANASDGRDDADQPQLLADHGGDHVAGRLGQVEDLLPCPGPGPCPQMPPEPSAISAWTFW